MSKIVKIINLIRSNNPLVHNITNYVVMNNTANALLAIGGSPVMAHAVEEIEDIVSISSSLVLNIGTLSKNWINSMIKAGKIANKKKIPIVFDPVGAGASSYRNITAEKILNEVNISVIRANASEILSLAKQSNITKGVDSTIESNKAIDAAVKLSHKFKCTVVISGVIDYIITQELITKIKNGSYLMSKVTGMGCTSTSIIATCLGVENNSHLSSVAGMAIMGIAGENAEKISDGPGSFQSNFIDCLYKIDSDQIKLKLNYNEKN